MFEICFDSRGAPPSFLVVSIKVGGPQFSVCSRESVSLFVVAVHHYFQFWGALEFLHSVLNEVSSLRKRFGAVLGLLTPGKILSIAGSKDSSILVSECYPSFRSSVRVRGLSSPQHASPSMESSHYGLGQR